MINLIEKLYDRSEYSSLFYIFIGYNPLSL
jgi:hypothetical protein